MVRLDDSSKTHILYKLRFSGTVNTTQKIAFSFEDIEWEDKN